jgi:hypothetical protein
MTGTLVAAASGIGFGLFQSLNVRAVRGMDPFASPFLAAVALEGAGLAGGGLDALAGA